MSDALPCLALNPGGCLQTAQDPAAEAASSLPTRSASRTEVELGTTADPRADGPGLRAGVRLTGRIDLGIMAGSHYEAGATLDRFGLPEHGGASNVLSTFGALTSPMLGAGGVQFGGRFHTEHGDFGERRALVAATASATTPLPGTQMSFEFGPEYASDDAGSAVELYARAELRFAPHGRVVDEIALQVGKERHAPRLGASAVFNVADEWGPLRDVNGRFDLERFEREEGTEFRQLSFGFEARVGDDGPELFLGVNAPRRAGDGGHRIVPTAGMRLRF